MMQWAFVLMAKKKGKRNTAKRRSKRSGSTRRSRERARWVRRAKPATRRSFGNNLGRPESMVEPRVAQTLKAYEGAMRLFNKQNFRRAKEILEKVVVGPSRELAERARVHLAICEQRLQRPAPVHLRSANDHYHYAVSQINLANYEEARPHLEKALKLTPKADYIHYALASVSALSGEAEDALEHLSQAIKLRPENRYHARNDSDFKLLQDDARFQELLYPERPIGSRAGEVRA